MPDEKTPDTPPVLDTKKQPPKTDTIENLAAASGQPNWATAALKARKGWPTGYTTTATEYNQQLSAFMDGPTVAERDGEA